MEISLDLDMVSAVCPLCHILLVEAKDNRSTNLDAAIDKAVDLGAKVVSTSFGAIESSKSELGRETHYNHPGVAITAANGDHGYRVEYPAASQYVTAVGGTVLKTSTNSRGWDEVVWARSFLGGFLGGIFEPDPAGKAATGSGCSRFVPKPSWQKDTGCKNRTVGDVAAVAKSLSVYDSFANSARPWISEGGTSASSPIIAAIYALSGSTSFNAGSAPYADPADLFDITSGNNGRCSPAYLCNAGPGYDGPTGLGTPHGISAFGTSGDCDNDGDVGDPDESSECIA